MESGSPLRALIDHKRPPVTPMQGDLSCRCYYRLETTPPLLLMETPPPLNMDSWQRAATVLKNAGLRVPHVYAQAHDAEGSLAIIEDFGPHSVGDLLQSHPALTTPLYELMTDVLIHLHRRPVHLSDTVCHVLPRQDKERLLDDVSLFYDDMSIESAHQARQDFIAAWRESLRVLDAPYPSVIVLRDYHGDNVMVMREDIASFTPSLPLRPILCPAQHAGIIDFQDALWGHPAYDMVSLLQDVRRDVSSATQDLIRARYKAALPDLYPITFGTVFSVLGALRHMRIFGVFGRLLNQAPTTGTPSLSSARKRALHLDTQRTKAYIKHALTSVPELAPVRAWVDSYTKGVFDAP